MKYQSARQMALAHITEEIAIDLDLYKQDTYYSFKGETYHSVSREVWNVTRRFLDTKETRRLNRVLGLRGCNVRVENLKRNKWI